MSFGEIIKSRRKLLKLTQDELGKIVGVTKTTIFDWEKEKYAPTNAANVSALEQALELEAGFLYKLIYGNPPPPSPPPEKDNGRKRAKRVV